MSWLSPRFQSQSDQGQTQNSVSIIRVMTDKLATFSLVDFSHSCLPLGVIVRIEMKGAHKTNEALHTFVSAL